MKSILNKSIAMFIVSLVFLGATGSLISSGCKMKEGSVITVCKMMAKGRSGDSSCCCKSGKSAGCSKTTTESSSCMKGHPAKGNPVKSVCFFVNAYFNIPFFKNSNDEVKVTLQNVFPAIEFTHYFSEAFFSNEKNLHHVPPDILFNISGVEIIYRNCTLLI